MSEKLIVLVDGECSLCKGWTYFAARRDGADRLRFASQQSPRGKELLDGHGVSAGETVVVLDGSTVYRRSSAVLEVLGCLDFPWRLCYAFKVVPWFLRDWVYDIVARYRTSWFGREDRDFCGVADGSLQKKLLD